MKHTYLSILLLLVSPMTFAQIGQLESFIQQRKVMLKQLELEKSYERLYIDPQTCQTPFELSKQNAVYNRNMKTLNETGSLKHCPDIEFVGPRKLTRNLFLQGQVIKKMLTLESQHESVAAKKDSKQPVVVIENPVDKTVPLKRDTQALFGTAPSRLPILAGYVDVPYHSNPTVDETFNYFHSNPNEPRHHRSKNLPPGLGFSNEEDGRIFGFPTRAGQYSSIIELSYWYTYGAQKDVFRGTVPMRVLPRPQFTVLNSVMRNVDGDFISFKNEPLPFLSFEFLKKNRKGHVASRLSRVRSLNGASSGKVYYEAEIYDVGEHSIIGMDPTNEEIFAVQDGIGISLNKQYPYFRNASSLEWRSFKRGDIVMIATDVDSKKIWFGVNGRWLHTMYKNIPRPESGLFPSTSLPRAKEFRAYAQGMKGTHLSFNFGQKTFRFNPPRGFTGIKFRPLDMALPNSWDSNTLTKTAKLFHPWSKLVGVPSHNFASGFVSSNYFTSEHPGDVAIALSPKKSGRWMFEANLAGHPHAVRVGIAPIQFKDLHEKHLGSSGTKSISIRRKHSVSNQSSKGIIEVDGKEFEIDTFHYEDRVTFVCDFDQKKINIFVQGKPIFSHALPAGVNEWVIASTNAGASVFLHTLNQKPNPKTMANNEENSGIILFPVQGAKAWTYDSSQCISCSSPQQTAAQPEFKQCEEHIVGPNGKSPSNEQQCLIPATNVNEFGKCMVPGEVYQCTTNQFGSYHCAHYMDDYDTLATCERECRSRDKEVVKKCEDEGWKLVSQ